MKKQGSIVEYKDEVMAKVRGLIDHFVPIQNELKILITFDLNDATVKWKGKPHSKLDGEMTFHRKDMENTWNYRRERKTDV